MNFQEARQQFQADRAQFERLGAIFPLVQAYVPPEWKADFNLAMDAQPALTTDPNAGIPAFLTTLIDPKVYEIIFAPNKGAEILGEEKKGSWLDETAMFPVVEHTGEVSSYGDFNNNGVAGANTNWPQRQAYLFQTTMQYGERELERAGLGRINWVQELNGAAATVLNKFANLTYFFGVASLQNYGITNDPGLSAALTPALKAYGNNRWITGGVVTATANEIFTDVQSLFSQIVGQTGGTVDQNAKMTLALSPGSEVALTATNSFNVNVSDLLKKNFPNLEIVTAVQFGALSATNPQGIAAGNMVQLWIDDIEGQQVGYCAFNEKMRAHKIVPDMSSWKQKLTSGTWGAIIRMPAGAATMVGV